MPDTRDRPLLQGRAGPAIGLDTHRLADGTVIAVQDTGPRDAEVTVVLVHGWSQDHTSWDDVVELLDTDHPDLRVVAYDARGHGRSDAGPRRTGTVDQFADDLADVVTGLVPAGQVVLAGHSLGGPIIMAFAQRFPDLLRDRVRGVLLVATSSADLGKDVFGLSARLTAPAIAVAPVVTKVRSWSRARVNLYHPGLIAWAIRRGFYGPGAATAHNRYRTAAQTSRSHPATVAQLVDEMIRLDRADALAVLDTVPTVILAGTKDGLCPIAHSRAMADAMPGAQFVVLPRAGHMLPYERPAEVTDQLVRLATK
ncbi:alpha/beta fold hydrolase [Jatrophihabitans endophyticus]|uniref:alpha/beta fold hydrolase n=1 Tax=Jatrophihabitans endophyticus TaxID=1206085 RepID=UPI0013565CB9|nr:alpha/beta hydrolase [Jatrophihabitans endophyticus]